MVKNLHLLSIWDRVTAEFVPVGVFFSKADMEEAKKKYRNYQWEDHKIPYNAIDDEVMQDYKLGEY